MRSRLGEDGGSIAPLVPIVIFALLIVGGLVVDGSRALNARGDAQAYAEEAARAGAGAIRYDSPTLALDTAEATRRVNAYCAAVKTLHGKTQIVTCALAPTSFSDATTCEHTTAQIVVNTQVTMHVDTTLLDMIGFSQFTVSGQASARPYEGTDAGNAC